MLSRQRFETDRRQRTEPVPGQGNRIARWVPSRILELSPYHADSADGLLKLDAMENPYTWPSEIKDQWLQIISTVPLNRYPDPQGTALRQDLKTWCGLDLAADLMLGNGSDELIQIIAMTLGGRGQVIMAPEPSFSMYSIIASVTGTRFLGVPRDTEFRIDLQACLDGIAEHQPCCVFLARPNNPTGSLCSNETVHAIIDAAPGLVVVDEAYHAFCGHTFLDRITDHDNLVVMRTFSKLGLAALRLGFLAGPKNWLDQFNKVRLPYNVNTLTQVSVRFALEHMEWFQGCAEQICNHREQLSIALLGLPDVQVYPSDGNFLLMRMPRGRGTEIFQCLRQSGILVKNLDGSHEALADCLRVSVSSTDDNQAFVAALRNSLETVDLRESS